MKILLLIKKTQKKAKVMIKTTSKVQIMIMLLTIGKETLKKFQAIVQEWNKSESYKVNHFILKKKQMQTNLNFKTRRKEDSLKYLYS